LDPLLTQFMLQRVNSCRPNYVLSLIDDKKAKS
jgi:hypothetical protein